MLIDDFHRISLRDSLTRINQSSLLAQVVYSKASYEGGPALPESDQTLLDAGSDTFVAAFSDAGSTAVPSTDEVTRAAANPLLLSRTLVGAHRGAQFIGSTPVNPPYVAEMEVSPLAWTAGAATYLNDIRYVGICFGLVFGPSKTGVFGFLLDDAGIKKIMLSGPDDGTGTRPGSVEVVHDWSLGYVYKFVWDPARGVVDVYARLTSDDAALAVLLHSFAIAGLGSFVNGVAFGPNPIGPTSASYDTFWGFLNLDSPTFLDSVESEFIRLFEFGRNVLVGGVLQAAADRVLTSSDLLALSPFEDYRDALISWTRNGATGQVVFDAEGTKVEKPIATADGAQRLTLLRDEPYFSLADGVMLYARFEAGQEQHFGSAGTGMGFSFDDGVGRLLVMLLDDFADKKIGVYQAGDNSQLASYASSLAVDWSAAVGIKMFVNGARNTITVWMMGADDVPLLTASLLTLAPSLGTPSVEFGHVDVYTLKPVYGTLTVQEYQYGLEVTEYDALEGVVPSAASPPWTEILAGAGVGSSTMVAGLFQLVDGDYGTGALQGSRIQRQAIATFGANIGATVEGRFLVSAWSNQAGNQKPLEPISAGFAIDDGTEIVQLVFVQTLYGKFVYLPGLNAAQSLANVLVQNVEGQAISSEVSFDQLHTYRLEKKPGQYIRLFIDDAAAPSIGLDWDVVGGFDIPATLGVGSGILFGSMDVSRKSTSSWKRCVFSAGNGYDLAVRPALSESERGNVFGTVSEVILHAEGI